MRKFLACCLLLVACLAGTAQDVSKQLPAVRNTSAIKIDGDISDAAWKTGSSPKDFVEQRPSFGRPEYAGSKTEVYLLYDDNAIYVGGKCHEASRDSISTELVGRDAIGVNDFIGVVLDTYLDKINGVGFFVTSLGEQFDTKYSLGNEDDSWNSVYESATRVGNDGWTFEMRIPYSALRFSKADVQNWGLNIIRRRSKTGQQYMWNPVDPQKFGLMNQAGVWTNIQNIKSPIRLSFSPYLSTYVNKNGKAADKDWKTSVNGGMDVKYGISKAFTLDMTLIPDFGQVQSDNQILNLTPFEVQFSENRAFFTEGTELFNKGNLFYSRRIGAQPLHYYNVKKKDPSHVIVKNPSETKLLNATKISGRTAKGLGIGFFNAITKTQYALVEDGSKQQYEVETNPLTNYNILVLDQTMKNNSSVSLVNSNVLRDGSDYDANVTAALWDLYDNKVDWNFWGKVANSNLFGYTDGKTLSGINYNVNLGKFRGPFNFEVHQFMADEKFQQNDLGYFTNNNYLDNGFWMGYKWTKPKGFYNNLYLNLNGTWSQRYKPRAYQYVSVNANINGQLKSLWNVGVMFNARIDPHDFYESRMGREAILPGSWRTGFWFGTNQAKKYSAGLDVYERVSPRYNATTTEVTLRNRYRFNDKLSVGLTTYTEFSDKNFGFSFLTPNRDSSIFGLRDRHTAENVLSLKYNFNTKMGLTLRARHYWSKVEYTEFFNLRPDLEYEKVTVTADRNINYNLFNMDLLYTWQFAQGSFINIAWKNAGEENDRDVETKYYDNLRHTLKNAQQNNLSVKVIYYLDYLDIKRKR